MTGNQGQKRQRTCVGCGSKSDKLAYLRVVKSSDGTVSFDPTGRKPGRGAYVCSIECLDKALKARKLQRALKTNIGPDDVERIVLEAGHVAERATAL